MSKPYVCQIDPQLADKVRSDLIEKGYTITQPQYTLFQAKKKGVSCTFYTSGKLVVMGKEMNELIEFYLEPEILKEFSLGYSDQLMEPHIGCDESGKGDLLGPLCVVALYADRAGIEKLLDMGVCDSKKVSDKKALALGEQISREFLYQSVLLSPKKYNELYPKFGNLNTMLAWAHATAIKELTTKSACSHVILDKFAHESVMRKALGKTAGDLTFVQRTKAEDDVVVAAASIVARRLYLNSLYQLSKSVGVSLAKGGGKHANQAVKELLSKHDKETLRFVAKLHFKNLDQILGR